MNQKYYLWKIYSNQAKQVSLIKIINITHKRKPESNNSCLDEEIIENLKESEVEDIIPSKKNSNDLQNKKKKIKIKIKKLFIIKMKINKRN